MHDRLYHEQKRWSAVRVPQSVLRQLALSAGVDSVRFERCYQDQETAKRIREFTKLAKKFSVDATPTFFVGERRIRGALPISLFRQVLLEAAVP